MNTDARQRDPLPTPAEIAKLPPDGGPEFNRLIHERSPYLLQHARNPVDWFPWGEEAFAKARKENKPIFLSVGYSSCHWCHVMEHESFEHDEIAKLLNELFVPVKVDREERPDIDDIYMVATQLMTGRGGWPNSLWLMPDGRPWYAGTYFPREDRLGQTGFKSLLVNLAQVWTNRPRDIEEQAKQLSDAIRENASLTNAPYQGPMDGLLSNAVARLAASYDATHGGFGGAPKFPPHSTLALLLHLHATRGDETALKLATGTLDAMHLGGIHDHVGGGFHRYATDERWFLPHFEKMLYDNAQLARVYATAFAQTGRADYRDTTAALCDWILRDMADAAGGFHSALDADSEGEEGKFYVWSRAEILQVLGPDDGALFCRVYDITDAGNYFEEATRKATALNIPWLKRLPAGNELKPLAAARGKLRDVRARRVWPMRDDKVLAAWNGLMVGGLAVAGRHLQEERYVRAATKAADFLLGTMTTSDGRLLRSYRAGRASIDGYLDDYAFVADGLLDLADTTGEAKWRDAAARLATTMLARFHDPERGGFFTTSDRHERLIVRHKDAFDQAAPSGNAIAIRVLLRLADAKNGYRDLAAATLRNNGELMRRAPSGTSALLHGLALLEASASARDPAVVASADHECLRAELFLAATAVSAGGTITGRVVLTMAESFHVNANPAGPDLIPTTLALAANKGLSLAPMTYPDGGTNRIYAGRTELPIHLRIDPAAPAGPITFELLVTAQPCDETSCRAPVTLSLKASLKVDAKRDE